MSIYRAIFFDADGVLIRAPKLFSAVYEERVGMEKGHLQPFFVGDFQAALAGKADLKELIVKNRDLWQWAKNPQILLDDWFVTENCPDRALLTLVKQRRAAGRMVCMATSQEAYRARYLREVMFPGLFDKYFISSELGCTKNDPHFFELALQQLKLKLPDLRPEEIVYFDDSQDHLDSAAQLGIVTCLYRELEDATKVLH